MFLKLRDDHFEYHFSSAVDQRFQKITDFLLLVKKKYLFISHSTVFVRIGQILNSRVIPGCIASRQSAYSLDVNSGDNFKYLHTFDSSNGYINLKYKVYSYSIHPPPPRTAVIDP
jgi:hypothetical protein